MNASVTVWRDGIIIHSLRFRDIATARTFATTYNTSARHLRIVNRALLSY